MMAGEETGNGKDCRSWEENIYWTHFHSVHFFRSLHGDFQSQLVIPKKFAENMKSHLHENVILKGPSGLTWKVGLAADEGGLSFKRGWDEFVRDHLLAENDVLMFRYIVDSRFEVLIFDHKSLCEKETSYFCKRRGHKEMESEVGMKRKAVEGFDSEDVVESPLPQDAERAPTEEPLKETVPATAKEHMVASRKRDLHENIGNGSSPIAINLEMRQNSKSHSASSTIPEENEVVKRRPARRGLGFRHVYVSSKKAALGPEQTPMIELAQDAMKSESFTVKIPSHHFSKSFYLSIPVEWADKYLSHCDQNLLLRIDRKKWKTRYKYTGPKSGGISTGWSKFARDNCLQESDVCLFNLGGTIEDGTIILDVTIFRSKDGAIPAVPVSSVPATEKFC